MSAKLTKPTGPARGSTPQPKITVTGATEAALMLRRKGYKGAHQQATMTREGESAQRQIRGVPVKTSRLQRGVTTGSEAIMRATDTGYTLATTVPYARFVFGGTKTMRARPPKFPNLGVRAAQAIASDLRRP
jgi:hypothetical protein